VPRRIRISFFQVMVNILQTTRSSMGLTNVMSVYEARTDTPMWKWATIVFWN